MSERAADPRTGSSAGSPASISPYCRHLESKKLMLAQAPPLVDRDVLDASQHCWCAQSFKILGPDGFAAHPADCRKGRACFDSPLVDLL